MNLLISGFGLGLALMPPLILVHYYFDKRRTFAAGISLMGHSCGTFITLPVLRLLIETYGWKGAVLIHSALVMNTFVTAGLYRPPVLEELEKKKMAAKDQQTNSSSNKVSNCLTNLWNIFKNIWDFSLFKDIVFVQYLIAVLLFQFGGDIMYKFTPLKGVAMGISKLEVAIFPSILGFSSTCARVFASVVGNLKCTNRIIMLGSAAILGSLAMFVSTLAVDFIYLAVCVGIYGLLLGEYWIKVH